MNREEFYEVVIDKLKERYEDSCEITINYVPKNNGIIRTAFNIRKSGSNISPVIYAEEFYDMYEGGVSFEEIINAIVEIYDMSKTESVISNVDSLTEWEHVKDKLAIKVVSKEKNKYNLDEVVWGSFLDLAIVPIVCVNDDKTSLSTFKINKALAAKWNIEDEDIVEAAIENNFRLNKTTCKDMYEVISGIMNCPHRQFEENEEIDVNGKNDIFPMKVLTNTKGINGASTILDNESLNNLYLYWGRPYYILPSSVHELICMPADDREADDIQALVKEVNSNHVSAEEVWSDNVYIYNGYEVRLVTGEGCD